MKEQDLVIYSGKTTMHAHCYNHPLYNKDDSGKEASELSLGEYFSKEQAFDAGWSTDGEFWICPDCNK